MLCNRRQRIVIYGVASEWTPVTSGAPQGCVLAPVLFTICTNNIGVTLNSLISKIAEDTKIGNSVLTDENKLNLQKDLLTISAWSERQEMLFGTDKCQVLQFGTKNKKYDYEMFSIKLKTVQCAKDLGVQFPPNLIST